MIYYLLILIVQFFLLCCSIFFFIFYKVIILFNFWFYNINNCILNYLYSFVYDFLFKILNFNFLIIEETKQKKYNNKMYYRWNHRYSSIWFIFIFIW